jgi:hypothetical protein
VARAAASRPRLRDRVADDRGELLDRVLEAVVDDDVRELVLRRELALGRPQPRLDLRGLVGAVSSSERSVP